MALILPASAAGLERAVAILRGGGVVAYPTDTVYGLGARSDGEPALARLFEVKGRPRHQPLPLLVAELSQIGGVAREVPLAVARLSTFWPGALTLVLPCAPYLSPLITGGGDTVAVRVPAHPVPIALIRALGVPLVGTSANRSGQPAPITAQGVAEQLDGLELILDGGACPGGVESTVVDLTTTPPRLLRRGAIPREAIERALGHSLLEVEPAHRPGR